jgi:hypothetical protein
VNLGKRAKLRPSSSLIPEAPISGVRRRGLMLDTQTEPHEARRFDCWFLPECEHAWCLDQIAENVAIGAQAKCPEECPHYARRTFTRPTTLDKTLKITRRPAA